ncbi:MAG TPA: acyl-CoA dehydrogenase family protein [Alphaproteobacteria bacterium]|nr:acyl-CoA dehydrogenase family protein [Alphaproteobacteria bacterium]
MDFGLSDDQLLLQRSAAEFLASECPASLVREVARDEEGFPRGLYRHMAELGWLGLIVPDTYGGAGLSFLDLVLLLEQLGRAVVPGPFFSSAVLATLAIMLGGTSAQRQAWLPRLAAGDAVGTLAWLEASDRLDPAGVAARARKSGKAYRLSGQKLFVTDAHVADVIVAAFRSAGRGEEGVTLFLLPRDTPGVTIKPLPSIDLTRRPMEVRFEDVELPAAAVLGAEHKGWKTLARLFDAAAVALAADSLGGAERALELAVDYAKVREQFGRAIGSFQAVKHIAAEMVSEIEPARSLLWYAAYACDSVPRDAARAASMAKACLSDVYSHTTNRAVQIHGGIGFTWEHDLHFWFKRAKWNEFAFGDATYHRERLAQLAKF